MNFDIIDSGSSTPREFQQATEALDYNIAGSHSKTDALIPPGLSALKLLNERVLMGLTVGQELTHAGYRGSLKAGRPQALHLPEDQ